MLNHLAALIACRTRLATLEVCTTGTTTLEATATGFVRLAGSFVTDGFQVGMEVLPAGFTSTARQVVKNVAALTLTVEGTPSASLNTGLTRTSSTTPNKRREGRTRKRNGYPALRRSRH
jgi:hypothetical protein